MVFDVAAVDTDTRNADKRRAQKEMLANLAAGMTVEEAATRAGRTIHTYNGWRLKDKKFAAEATAARARARNQGAIPDWRGGFADFRKIFFGLDTFAHQVQIVDALEKVGPREVVMVLLWPESGKTQTLTDWICMTLALDPNRRITVLSEAQAHATKIVSHIKTRMTDAHHFADYIVRFGPFQDENSRGGKPWTNNYLTVAKSDHDERDYSLTARAIGSSAYGSRIDDLIIDDVQSEKNLNQTEDILRTIRQTYLTRGRHMRTLYIGTRIANGDVPERLIESGVVDRLIELPAMNAHTGELTCPDIWVEDPDEYETRDDLIAAAQKLVATTRKQITEPIWEASYQQNPQAEGLATFTDTAIGKSKNSKRTIGPAPRSAFVVLSLDPALDGGNSLTACEHLPTKLKILDAQIDYGLARNEAILQRVETFALNYRPQLLIVEADAQQKGLVADERLDEMARKLGFTVLPHITSGKKLNNPLAVAAMATSFARGEIDLPWADTNCQERFAELVSQLRKWRPNVPTKLLRQDAVMSLWFNWHHWTKTRKDMESVNLLEAVKLTALPYPPTPIPVRSLS